MDFTGKEHDELRRKLADVLGLDFDSLVKIELELIDDPDGVGGYLVAKVDFFVPAASARKIVRLTEDSIAKAKERGPIH